MIIRFRSQSGATAESTATFLKALYRKEIYSTDRKRGRSIPQQRLKIQLECVKHPLAQEWKASSPISLSFDQFEFGHMALNYTIIDPPGEPCSHRLFAFLYSGSKRLQLGKRTFGHLL